MQPKLPIGISDFCRVIKDEYYYIDKSLLIKELIDNDSQTVLLPRPRRFGKTLNLSMLRYYFEKTAEDTSRLFHDLAIWQQDDAYTDKQGQYPVISLTFKDVKCQEWKECSAMLYREIGEEYRRHRYLMDSDQLDAIERAEYVRIMDLTASKDAYAFSLKKLSVYLERYYGRKTIILIDEYDTPIQEGYLHNYYDDAIVFMRNMLSGALKDNTSLEKGVLTGILRVAKESIFSGLNNLRVYSLLATEFSTHFGLLENEVEAMLADYKVGTAPDEVKIWYNGYVFGGTTVYNPWSMINFTASWRSGLQPYWVNTSGNELIRQLITESGGDVKQELERLISGETVRRTIDDNIGFRDIQRSPDALWSFLLMSGYLKAQSDTLIVGIHHCDLAIPNREVGVLYRQIIMGWFDTGISGNLHHIMLRALVDGDIETFGEIFSDFVAATFSMFDTSGQGDAPEKVYHAFVLGMFLGLADTHEVKSNRESGYGRYDVMLIPKQTNHLGIVIEFKKARRNETLESAAAAALAQIEAKRYTDELHTRGVQRVLHLGVAFSGKQLLLQSQMEQATEQ